MATSRKRKESAPTSIDLGKAFVSKVMGIPVENVRDIHVQTQRSDAGELLVTVKGVVGACPPWMVNSV